MKATISTSHSVGFFFQKTGSFLPFPKSTTRTTSRPKQPWSPLPCPWPLSGSTSSGVTLTSPFLLRLGSTSIQPLARSLPMSRPMSRSATTVQSTPPSTWVLSSTPTAVAPCPSLPPSALVSTLAMPAQANWLAMLDPTLLLDQMEDSTHNSEVVLVWVPSTLAILSEVDYGFQKERIFIDLTIKHYFRKYIHMNRNKKPARKMASWNPHKSIFVLVGWRHLFWALKNPL